MIENKAALNVYLFSGILFLFSVVFESEMVALIFKPMIIPSIFFYYIKATRRGVSIPFSISLLLFFLGDMLFLISQNDFYELAMLFFLGAYIFVNFFIFQDLFYLYKTKAFKRIDYSFLIIFGALVLLVVTILELLETSSFFEGFAFLLFGLELVLMGVMSAILYFNSKLLYNKMSLFLVLSVAAFITSDLFFILDNKFYSLPVFELINASAQVGSYYLYVCYFLERSRQIVSYD
ncbi:hypothetical protein ACFS5J_05425 [Flavobacterium chuncheonense]|uniref:YhhN-like protein n=1 Tax=Flavobacterium chuncheonense TaxID=2026653 RepID=A0ABW5YK99_9FLAO